MVQGMDGLRIVKDIESFAPRLRIAGIIDILNVRAWGRGVRIRIVGDPATNHLHVATPELSQTSHSVKLREGRRGIVDHCTYHLGASEIKEPGFDCLPFPCVSCQSTGLYIERSRSVMISDEFHPIELRFQRGMGHGHSSWSVKILN